jgi:colanic acid biosynthesis glycosyl transferase WcaI
MLASAKPVIVTACPGTELGDVMAPLGRVVPPGRPDLLAEAILDLDCNADLRAELGRRGRAFVEATWERDIVLDGFLTSLQAI